MLETSLTVDRPADESCAETLPTKELAGEVASEAMLWSSASRGSTERHRAESNCRLRASAFLSPECLAHGGTLCARRERDKVPRCSSGRRAADELLKFGLTIFYYGAPRLGLPNLSPLALAAKRKPLGTPLPKLSPSLRAYL
jgi:hypothetical protein